MSTPHLLMLAGTRPEALKIAPLADTLRMPLRWCWSGQQSVLPTDVAHLPWQVFPSLQHPMRRPALVDALRNRLVQGLLAQSTAAILVQGDTATAYAGALAGQHLGIPVIHLEAGLRSGNHRAPFPEEIYRRRISAIAGLHLAPSALAKRNLLLEGIDPSHIACVGSTAIDRLPPPRHRSKTFDLLVDVHRRENFGRPMQRLAQSLQRLVDRGLRIALAGPLNPLWASRMQTLPPEVRRLPPMHREQWIETLASSKLVLSDSGGAAEELPYLGIPLLAFRRATERPEPLISGHARQLHPDAEDMVEAIDAAMRWAATPMPAFARHDASPYGGGRAAEKAAHAIERFLHRPPAIDSRTAAHDYHLDATQ